MDTLGRLNSAWTEIQAGSSTHQFVSVRISADLQLNVHAAIRGVDNASCLLVDLPSALTSIDYGFEVAGMRLYRTELDSNIVLVLSLEEAQRREMFAKVCADAIDQCSDAATAVAAVRLFLDRLDSWRLFLRDVRPQMTGQEIVGLMGELLFIDRCLQVQPRMLSAWKAPSGGLHDFVAAGHAIEVKTTLGPSQVLGVSRLDQLDSSGLRRLDLTLVRLMEDPAGRSLREIVAGVKTRLPADQHNEFENSLLKRGLSPDDDSALDGFRVSLHSEKMWTVTADFPRLVRSNVAASIVDVSYTLDTRSIASFSVDYSTTIQLFTSGLDNGLR